MNKFVSAALAGTLLIAFSGSTFADNHGKAAKQAIKYRQAAMTLVGANFKPMGAMVKGKQEWDQEKFKSLSADLASVAALDHMRGYPKGSDSGKTKAKKAIWENMDDYKAKMGEFREAAAKLAEVAASGDQAATKDQFGVTGKTCKSCHKEYKEKD